MDIDTGTYCRIILNSGREMVGIYRSSFTNDEDTLCVRFAEAGPAVASPGKWRVTAEWVLVNSQIAAIAPYLLASGGALENQPA